MIPSHAQKPDFFSAKAIATMYILCQKQTKVYYTGYAALQKVVRFAKI